MKNEQINNLILSYMKKDSQTLKEKGCYRFFYSSLEENSAYLIATGIPDLFSLIRYKLFEENQNYKITRIDITHVGNEETRNGSWREIMKLIQNKIKAIQEGRDSLISLPTALEFMGLGDDFPIMLEDILKKYSILDEMKEKEWSL